MKIVGVTSCPSGVAHTYLAAEALILSGEKYGVEVLIETQGGAGIENRLQKKDIKEAVCVILTNDIAIMEVERFKGKKVLKVSVSDIIKKSDSIIGQIVQLMNN
ncbi:MAG: PTS fructose-like transporter subunit IIB [Faecalibacillus sp.]